VEHPEEFRDGTTAPGSEAEKLTKALQEEAERYHAADHGQAIEAAEIRLRRAEEEAKRAREQRGREAIAELLPEAEAAVERFKSWAEGGPEAIAAIHDVSHRATAIAVQARLDRPPSYDHYERLVRELGQSANPPLPLPRSVLGE
jgi:hypothetical protein